MKAAGAALAFAFTRGQPRALEPDNSARGDKNSPGKDTIGRYIGAI
jgi:hypothetical protein